MSVVTKMNIPQCDVSHNMYRYRHCIDICIFTGGDHVMITCFTNACIYINTADTNIVMHSVQLGFAFNCILEVWSQSQQTEGTCLVYSYIQKVGLTSQSYCSHVHVNELHSQLIPRLHSTVERSGHETTQVLSQQNLVSTLQQRLVNTRGKFMKISYLQW